MVIPACGTFDYLTIVPENMADNTNMWPVRSRGLTEQTGDSLHDDRLVGLSPTLQVTDAGRPSDAGSAVGTSLATVSRSRFTLNASSRKGALVKAASFYVAKIMASALQPGDALHMVRTPCGGLGVSALRNGELIFAAGAITEVPLGSSVTVRIPGDLVQQAENVFKSRDPEFEFHELPIEVKAEEHVRISYGGFFELGRYQVWVGHGFYPGIPGTEECMGLGLIGICKPNAARASAQLLESNGLEMVEW